MDFNNAIDIHRSQIKFYQIACLALIGVIAILAVIVPSAMKSGPYVVRETDTLSTVVRAEPWKMTVGRVEGFLKYFLSARFEWSKENFDTRKDELKTVVTDQVFSKLKESIVGYGAIAKSQEAKGFFVIEGFRFSNDQHIIEAQISRIIRVGGPGVVTPLVLKLTYEDTSVSDANPYGLRIKAIEEGPIAQGSGENR